MSELEAQEDNRPYRNLPEDLRTKALATHDALHKLWTKAVGTEGYVKPEWQSLERAIDQIINHAKGQR